MTDRQRLCIIVISLLILASCGYLGYYLFFDTDHVLIEYFNRIRLCIFFGQHLLTLVMFCKLANLDDQQQIVIWMLQLSTIILLACISGEIFIVFRGGRILGIKFINFEKLDDTHQAIIEFQLNQITLYFQIMTDFVMFFIISAIATIILKCRAMNAEQKYQFIIENLKSENYIDEPNSTEKKACAICLTDLETQKVLKLPCKHFFHKQCLVNWLKRSTICPLCRTDIEFSIGQNQLERHSQANDTVPNINPQSTFVSRPQQRQFQFQSFINSSYHPQPSHTLNRNIILSNQQNNTINNNHQRLVINQPERFNQLQNDSIKRNSTLRIQTNQYSTPNFTEKILFRQNQQIERASALPIKNIHQEIYKDRETNYLFNRNVANNNYMGRQFQIPRMRSECYLQKSAERPCYPVQNIIYNPNPNERPIEINRKQQNVIYKQTTPIQLPKPLPNYYNLNQQ